MNIVFIILTSINALIYIYVLAKDLVLLKEQQLLQKAFNKGASFAKEIEDDILSEKDKATKSGKIIGYIIVLIALLSYLIIMFLPIIIGFIYNIETAIATYLIFLLFTTFPRLYKMGRPDKYDGKRIILYSLIGLFKFQVIIIVLFGFNFSLESIINDIYTSGYLLSNTLTILTPILFFSTIIITVYLYWKGLVINSKLPEERKKYPRLIDALIILVISSVAGLIYLFEMSIDTQGNIAFDRLLDLLFIILGSILVPSLFSFFNNKNHTILDRNKLDTKSIDENRK